MAQINYQNKADISTSTTPVQNKVSADDMNEIKNVVNTNDTNVGDLSNLNTTDKTSIVNAINEIDGRFIYSTTEKVVGTWIDGKPTYRKVIDFGALPNNSSKSISHNISNIDEFVSIKGIAKLTNETYYPIPHVPNGNMFSGLSVSIRANLTQLTIATNGDATSHYAYVILDYTKTTD